jgi:salicylate hydroxylase
MINLGLKVAIAGGGIGGLAAALALSRLGQQVELFEKAAAFSEVGAGIQLGPNATRVLQAWGLTDALLACSYTPERLQVRDAVSGRVLGELMLGSAMAARYGAPYVTLHRADLHGLLLKAVQQTAAVLRTDCATQSFQQTAQTVVSQSGHGAQDFDILIGADGLWSNTRQQLLNDGPPRRTGHLAYRALIKQTDLPMQMRCQNVTAWLGSNMHAVQYPVRGGEWLNIVVFIHGDAPDDFQNWDHTGNAADLSQHLAGCCTALRDMLQPVTDWRLWALFDRPPIQSANQLAQGRVALLGDAAHPMRPYLAQGAGMAIEDAAELGLVLNRATPQIAPTALQHYAANRWQRNARVQARALRNGEIFHVTGPVRWSRDVAMKLMGEKLLDIPWLYRYQQSV